MNAVVIRDGLYGVRDIFYDIVDTACQNDIIGEKFMSNVSKGRLNE